MAAPAQVPATAAEPSPAPDRAPDWVAAGTPEPLRSKLLDGLGREQCALRALDLVRYASDASPYRLIPRAVAIPRDPTGVARLFAIARETHTPVVFRAGGTSLNGQSQTDGILVDARRHWRRATIEDGGLRVRTQPGVILGHLNRRLARHGRRMGPDPASTDIACIGGVIANNSGGMRCGVTQDTYSTLRSLEFVLTNGARVDSAAPDAHERFVAAAPELAAGLAQIRDEVRSDSELVQRIRRKFQIKNTTGYRLCAFLDADEPLDIFTRLLVGSEGTLAFVSEAVMDTVPLGRLTSLALVIFDGVDAAVPPVPQLVAAGATATELLVTPLLIAAGWNMPGAPEAWKQLDPQGAALLVEVRAEDEETLATREREALEILNAAGPSQPARFTRDRSEVEIVWRAREGAQGLLAALRPPGVTMIIEDVCVPPERIGEAAKDLQRLLAEHGFLPGIAGHASAGNLHFTLTPAFGDQEDVERYEAFMRGLVQMIVGTYDGSLKAEHGPGINMAPYVESEGGAHATELMWRVKKLADPDGVLAPGVVLTREQGAHLRNLKSVPVIEQSVTQCIECGFCEPICPSRDLTTTPRQRIAIWRELARQPAGSPVGDALMRQFEYDGLETCAADGTCSLACPVAIDTGAFIKHLRAERHSDSEEAAAAAVARRWGLVERTARFALRVGALDGGRTASTVTGLLRRAISHELLPMWVRPMPPPAPALPAAAVREQAAAVYFPACVNRIFGAQDGAGWLPRALVELSARAGVPLWIPPDVEGACCATPWASKGYERGREEMSRRTAEAILRWTDEGRLPLVCDASSCTLGVVREIPHAVDENMRERLAAVEVIDALTWTHDRLLARCSPIRRVPSIAVHVPCAATHLGLRETVLALAAALAEEVHEPAAGTCCGTAGDRGLLHPELPVAALASARDELERARPAVCVSSNRTCEMGLTHATGCEHAPLIAVLEQASR